MIDKADKILAKYEDDNEYHFHECDRAWIIGAMIELAESEVKKLNIPFYLRNNINLHKIKEMKKKTEKDKKAVFAPQMYSVLKELQESASYWSEYDVPLGIVDRINDVLENVENVQKTYRKEYQKQYQKDYAASGKKKEAQSRYYQKHKYEICEKLQNKRKNLQINK